MIWAVTLAIFAAAAVTIIAALDQQNPRRLAN